MNYKSLLLIFAVAAITACNNNSTKSNDSQKDSDSVVVEQKELVGDSTLTNTAKYYADMVDASASHKILDKVDTLVGTDMKDLRDKCNYVFYPFSGPDFLYPHTIFPNADVYFMLGLESPGTILDKKLSNSRFADSAKTALRVYLSSSFFITKEMRHNLASDVLDGTLPVITMLMVKDDCQIISIKYKKFAQGGKIVDTDSISKMVEVQFFSNKTPKHLQKLYFCSCNVKNKALDPNLVAYVNNTLPKQYVVTFLKAASYLMHTDSFTSIRDLILNNSKAVIGDDSGIPYRAYNTNWDITIYGKYKHPQSCFSANKFQPDLDSLYKTGVARPLNFKIGYNTPSNWMVARKKG